MKREGCFSPVGRRGIGLYRPLRSPGPGRSGWRRRQCRIDRQERRAAGRRRGCRKVGGQESNDVKLDIKVDGSKLSGTIENTQFPGPIEFKDGKLEGNTIAFSYMRSMGGQEIAISWTGTLSGDELKLKRSVGGGR